MEPVRDDQPTPDGPEPDEATTPRPGLPPPTALESLVNALLEAGPDVADHVVRAAQELLLAAQAVVDAAERAVDEQRDLRPSAEPVPPPQPASTATVHPIERNE
jgi:hypothetical protein